MRESTRCATTGATIHGPVRHRIISIHGVPFHGTSTILRLSGSTETLNTAIWSARHGGLTYFLVVATVRGTSHSARIATDAAAIVDSLELR